MGKGSGAATRLARHEPAAGGPASPKKKALNDPGQYNPTGEYMAPQQMGFWPPDAMYMRGLQELILNQVHYYFSPENLVKDEFLRKHMDVEGWLPIQLLASFNRLRHITTDPHLVAEVRRRPPRARRRRRGVSPDATCRGDRRRAHPLSSAPLPARADAAVLDGA